MQSFDYQYLLFLPTDPKKCLVKIMHIFSGSWPKINYFRIYGIQINLTFLHLNLRLRIFTKIPIGVSKTQLVVCL